MLSRKRQKVNEDGKSRSINREATAELVPVGNSKEDHRSSRTLFIRSLPPTTTDEDLIQFFSQTTVVKHAVSVLDKDSKQCKGYGFVTFADEEDAINAQATLNGKNLGGEYVQIEIAQPRRRGSQIDDDCKKRSRDLANRQSGEDVKSHSFALDQAPPRLIIRNLPWSVKEDEQLAQLFLSFGKVKEAKLPRSKNGMLRGFGFVLLRGRKNAEKAISQLNGKLVDGRNIAVDWAAPKNIWEESQNMGSVQERSYTGMENIQNGDADLDALTKVRPRYEDRLGNSDESPDSSSDVQSDTADDIFMDAESSESIDSVADKSENFETEDKNKTIFVRNLPFSVDDAALYEHFRRFGPLRYARVVMDHVTDAANANGRSRGSGFVCFHNSDDANRCLSEAPRRLSSVGTTERQYQIQRSVLQDANEDPKGLFTIEGRILQIDPYIDRGQAQRLEADGKVRREREDKRYLFLLREGVVSNKSALHSLMSPLEIRMRDASSRQRQDLIKRNPSLHLSLTRLAVRNIPRHITSKELKALAREAVVGFARDVKEGLRAPLTTEERRRDLFQMSHDKLERKSKDKGKGVVKQAKVIFENREGSKTEEKSAISRSRGYGFIEYKSHRCALMGLRWLNGHLITHQNTVGHNLRGPNRADTSKRLIVEFAIENAQVVKRRHDREQKSRQPQKETVSQHALQNVDESRALAEQYQGATGTENQGKNDQPEYRSPDSKGGIRQRIIGRKRAKRRSRK